MLKKRRYMFSGAEVDSNEMNDDDSETESDSSEKSETALN
jgi:hypothetical protein